MPPPVVTHGGLPPVVTQAGRSPDAGVVGFFFFCTRRLGIVGVAGPPLPAAGARPSVAVIAASFADACASSASLSPPVAAACRSSHQL